ncbi:Ubiquitin conjugation factor e4, partial [Globisporangium polare]
MFVLKRKEPATPPLAGGGDRTALEEEVAMQDPNDVQRPVLASVALALPGRRAGRQSRDSTRQNRTLSATTIASEQDEYMAMLRGMQQLVVELLDVHALSTAIEYRANAPIAVNVREWWRHVQQKSILACQRRMRRGGSGGESNDTSARQMALPDLISGLSGDAQALQDVFTEALFKILQALDRVNRRMTTAAAASQAPDATQRATEDVVVVLENVDDTIAYAAGQLLETWEEAAATAMDEVSLASPSSTL